MHENVMLSITLKKTSRTIKKWTFGVEKVAIFGKNDNLKINKIKAQGRIKGRMINRTGQF